MSSQLSILTPGSPLLKTGIIDLSKLEDPSRSVVWILAATLVFNCIDIILTLAVVTTGHAVEANPVMQWLLSIHPVTFALVKLLMVSLGVWALWRARTLRIAQIGTWFVFGVYLALTLYHTRSLGALLS